MVSRRRVVVVTDEWLDQQLLEIAQGLIEDGHDWTNNDPYADQKTAKETVEQIIKDRKNTDLEDLSLSTLSKYESVEEMIREDLDKVTLDFPQDTSKVFEKVRHPGLVLRPTDTEADIDFMSEVSWKGFEIDGEDLRKDGHVDVTSDSLAWRQYLESNPFYILQNWQNQLIYRAMQTGTLSKDFCLNFVGEHKRRKVEEIGSSNVGELVTVEGQIQSRSKKYEYKHAVEVSCQECSSGSLLIYQRRNGGDLDRPKHCLNTNCDGKMSVDGFVTTDRREAIVQDIPSESRFSNPDDIRCVVDTELCNRIEAGEKVRLNAVVLREDIENKSSDLYLYVVGIQKDDEIGKQFSVSEHEFRSVARENDMIEYLEESVCPKLVGDKYSPIRKSILLQLVCGDFENMIERDTSHMMLVGDPSVGKSDFLEWVDKVSPISEYASGESSTSVGITAAVDRQEKFEGSDWVLNPGSIPRASGGVACLDELDKMDDSEKKSLNSPMAKQEVIVNKAVISTTLNAETNILAASNPSEGRIDRRRPLDEQIDVHTSFLPRFDLIFLLTDEVEDDEKERTEKIVEAKRELSGGTEEIVSEDWIREYVEYCRNEVDPEFTEEADDALAEYFSEIRSVEGSDRIQVTTRSLGALERLARSHARLNLREKVRVEDVNVAYQLKRESLEQLGILNPNSGWDIDGLETGISQEDREILEIAEEVEEYSEFVARIESEIGGVNGRVKKLKDEDRLLVDEERDTVRRL
jgi:replicative DNA helicase Mcm